jgi:hypothetical protein
MWLKNVGAFKPPLQRDGLDAVKHGRATQASACPDIEAEIEELIPLTGLLVLFTDNRTPQALIVVMIC